MKNILLLVISFFTLSLTNANAQVAGWLWAQTVGGHSYSSGNDICSDHNGNIIVAGMWYGDSICFGNSLFLDTATNGSNFFMVKYDPAGNIIWVKSVIGTDRVTPTAIYNDMQNNIIVVGYYRNRILCFGTDTLYNDSLGPDQIFIAKFDSDGHELWARSAGDRFYYDHPKDVCTDSNGNIFVTGFFSRYITFGNILVQNSDTLHPSTNAFIVKYDSTGNAIWAKGIGDIDIGGEISDAITVDAHGNVIIAGEYDGRNVIIETDTFFNTQVFDPHADIFIVKYNNAGNLLWAKSGRGDFIEKPYSLSTDQNENILLTGTFDGYELIFDTIHVINPATPAIANTAYVAKFDSSGNTQWMIVPSFYGLSDGSAYSVCTDPNNNVYVTGSYFNGVYLSKYDSSGVEIRTKTTTGNPASSNGICINPFGSIFITGDFQSISCSFDSILLHNSTGGWTCYDVARLNECTFSSDSLSIAQCDSAEINSIVYHTSGVYNQVLTNAAGCDSLVTIDLNINHLDLSTTVLDSNIIAMQPEAIYQWLDCNNAFAVIPLATNQTYTATANGDYSVAMTLGACADTSECVSLLSLNSITLSSDDLPITISPNPAVDKFIIRKLNERVDQIIEVSIFNILGEKVLSTALTEREAFYCAELKSGTYITQVRAGTKTFTNKLVVQ